MRLRIVVIGYHTIDNGSRKLLNTDIENGETSRKEVASKIGL